MSRPLANVRPKVRVPKRLRSVPHLGTREIISVAAMGVVGGLLATAAALRRWERSTLAAERVASLPDAKELLVRASDGAELAVFVAGDRDDPTPSEPEEVQGTGRGLFVLAHGWTNDSRVWGPVALRLLEAGHRVVAYDHRGHGRSTIGSAGLTLEALADDLWTVLEEFDARDAVVVGHSMGGMTAQMLATRRPQELGERVCAMVLVATACQQVGAGPGGRGARDRLAERLGPRVVADPRLDRAMRSRTFGPFLVRRTVGREACRSHLDALCEMFVATPPEVRAGFLGTMATMDLSQKVRDIALPVTIVAGEQDNLLPPSHSRQIANLVPGSRLVEVPGAGHMLPIEVPDLVADLLSQAARQAGGDRQADAAGRSGAGTASSIAAEEPRHLATGRTSP